ncbi:MAG: response regulator [bacterium]
MARQLVTLMGGDIVLDSQAGRGTKVTITLPIPETAAPPETRGAAAEASGNTDRLKGVKLLCADDNSVNLVVLREMLSSTGAIITEVENGQQAVDAWAEALEHGEPFGMLLMDIAMPVRDGLSALTEIRAAEQARQLKQVPAIAVTANAMPHQITDYIIGGFDTHLAKPFKRADLLHALHTLM